MHVDAYDDAGKAYGPVTLALGAGETVHFDSHDLEAGNAAKGLEGSTGAGEGHWRLEFTSALELEVLAYIRTDDGFLTSMHDVVPRTEAGHRVVTFNPGRNTSQVSSLRLINRGADSAEVRIEGIDDDGASPGGRGGALGRGRGIAHGERAGARIRRGGERCARHREWEVAAGGERRPAHRGNEPALESHRSPDQPVDSAEPCGRYRDRGRRVPGARLGAGGAVELHPLSRRGRKVGEYPAGVRDVDESRARGAQPRDVRALRRGGGRRGQRRAEQDPGRRPRRWGAGGGGLRGVRPHRTVRSASRKGRCCRHALRGVVSVGFRRAGAPGLCAGGQPLRGRRRGAHRRVRRRGGGVRPGHACPRRGRDGALRLPRP